MALVYLAMKRARLPASPIVELWMTVDDQWVRQSGLVFATTISKKGKDRRCYRMGGCQRLWCFRPFRAIWILPQKNREVLWNMPLDGRSEWTNRMDP